MRMGELERVQTTHTLEEMLKGERLRGSETLSVDMCGQHDSTARRLWMEFPMINENKTTKALI